MTVLVRRVIIGCVIGLPNKWGANIFSRATYLPLFLSLLVYFFIFPSLSLALPRLSHLVDAFMLAIFLSACRALISKKRIIFLAVALLLLGLAGIWTNNIIHHTTPRLIGCLFLIGFSLVIIASIVKKVMVSPEVDFDVICGALCGYLLLAMMWSLIYQVLALVWDGSFVRTGGQAVVPLSHVPADQDWSSFIYFSFVTITTLGYGDITPGNSPAGHMAALEAVVGQFYMVVLVARLVGQYTKTSGK